MLTPMLLLTLFVGVDNTESNHLSDGILTPAMVVAGAEEYFWNDPITVRFHVAHVSTMPVTRLDGTSYTQYRLHTASALGLVEINGVTGGGFYVALSPDFVKSLRRVGVPHVSKHFMNKSVVFTGRLAAGIFQYAGMPTSLRFYMPIEKLDDLRSVKDSKATSTTSKAYELPTVPNYGHPR